MASFGGLLATFRRSVLGSFRKMRHLTSYLNRLAFLNQMLYETYGARPRNVDERISLDLPIPVGQPLLTLASLRRRLSATIGFVRRVGASLLIAVQCLLATIYSVMAFILENLVSLGTTPTATYRCPVAGRVRFSDRVAGLFRAACSSDAARRRIGRNHCRRSCRLIMAGLAGDRRPEWYQGSLRSKRAGFVLVFLDDHRKANQRLLSADYTD